MFAADMVSAIRDGHTTSRNIVESSLHRIEADSALAAWVHVDAEGALARPMNATGFVRAAGRLAVFTVCRSA